jgi:hypothetical protein
MGSGKYGINPIFQFATEKRKGQDFLMHRILAIIISIGSGSLTYGQDLKEPPNIFKSSPEFAPQTTELGKYQHKLYLSIGTKWNLKVQQTTEQIGKDRVVFKFHVNPDGNINNIEIVEGNPNSKLATISKEAIADGGANCGPFSEVLKKEKPDGFDWQLAYRIY